MKKKLLLAALGLLVAAQAVAAPFAGPHKTSVPLKFRTHVAAPSASTITSTPNSGYDAMGWYVDSLYSTRTSGTADAGPGTAALDTTAAISTKGWTVAPSSSSVGDSGTVCIVQFMDAGYGNTASSGNATDSLYVVVQGSADGVNWVSLCLDGRYNGSNAASFPLPALATPVGRGVVSVAANVPLWSTKYHRAANVAASNTNCNSVNDILCYDFVRFITFGDRTAAALYQKKAKIVYWSAEADDLNR